MRNWRVSWRISREPAAFRWRMSSWRIRETCLRGVLQRRARTRRGRATSRTCSRGSGGERPGLGGHKGLFPQVAGWDRASQGDRQSLDRYRSSTGILLMRCECAAISSAAYFRCTRCSEGGCFSAKSRSPFPCRTDRARYEPVTAVRADVGQFRLHAIRAKRALIGANPRVGRIRRQILIAILAIRPRLQSHLRPPDAAAAPSPPGGSFPPPGRSCGRTCRWSARRYAG